jgi:hypothetical protein
MKKRLFFLTIILGLALGGPAFAAGATKEVAPGTSVEMPILIAPMIVDGKLSGYAYVANTILTTSPNAAIDVRDKIPFIQDAFVRDVNGASIAKGGDPNTVDIDGLTARLLACVRRVVGTAKIAGVRLTQVQLAPLRTTPGG